MLPKVPIFNQVVMFRQYSRVMLNEYLKNVPMPTGVQYPLKALHNLFMYKDLAQQASLIELLF